MERVTLPLEINIRAIGTTQWMFVCGVQLGTEKAVKRVIDSFLKAESAPRFALGMACLVEPTSEGGLSFLNRQSGFSLEMSREELVSVLNFNKTETINDKAE